MATKKELEKLITLKSEVIMLKNDKIVKTIKVLKELLKELEK